MRAGGGVWSLPLRLHQQSGAVSDDRTVTAPSAVRFRNEMEAGSGGRQIQIEDPDGNPIELFEPDRH
jgi:glyoxylase I family protein